MSDYIKKPNIYLVGFMGSGKTTVAKKLSSIYGSRDIDIDSVVESRIGYKIPVIFEKLGEEAFRDMERRVLEDISCDGVIVSCGGGTALSEENVNIMKDKGFIVYLTVEAETVLKRIGLRKDRPLLKGRMNKPYILDMIKKRDPYYKKAADYIIRTDSLCVDEVVMKLDRIIMQNIK